MNLSVVVATHNRGVLLRRLLDTLSGQTLAPERFEVVVVDDGSSPPAAEALEGRSTPFDLTLVRQSNAGPASARHRGVGAARGDVVVIIDDDMELDSEFLSRHLEAHEGGADVVLGNILPAPGIDQMPLFERFHARVLTRFAREAASGRLKVQGIHLCTGNLSVRRELYHKVGGFDLRLPRSEDRELGVRLEAAGASLAFAPEARSVHASDHADLGVWLGRAYLYGVSDSRIAAWHPEDEAADPWRFLFLVNPVSRPLLLTIVLWPGLGRATARGLMSVAGLADRLGGERVALAFTTLAYGVEYFRGMRDEAGSFSEAMKQLAAYRRKRAKRPAETGGGRD